MISASAFAKGFGETGSCAALLLAASRDRRARRRRPQLRAHRVTINAGIVWSGGYDVGDATAQLRGNGTGRDDAAVHAVHGRFAFRDGDRARAASRRVADAAAGDRRRRQPFRSPRIGVSIAGDPEAPAQELPGEELQQYLFDGGADLAAADSIGPAAGAVCDRAAPAISASCTKIARSPRPGRSTMPVAAPATGCAAGTATSRPIGLRGEFARELAQERHRLRGQDAHLPDLLACSLLRLASDIAVQFVGVSASRGGRRVLRDVSIVDRRRRDRCAGRTQRLRQDDAAAPHQSADRARCRRA